MLGKLLKYDLKWVYKTIIVFYILALIFSIIGRALSLIENSVIFSLVSQIAFGIAISMMANSLINCFMRLWVRFIRNVYKDESYLTHTLPVGKKTIYLSKILSALITICTTTIVIAVCVFICYYSEANIEALKTALELTAGVYNTTVLNFLLLVAVILFLEIMFIVLVGYVAIILGHKYNKNKMPKTIIIGFLLYMLTQALTLAFVFIFGLFNPEVMNLINTTNMVNVETIKQLMYVAIGVYVVYIAFFYIFGKKQFEKGVNIE